MTGMDADEQRLLGDGLRALLERTDPAQTRSALADFGLADLLADEPAVAVPTLFALQGELLTATSALDDVVLVAAGLPGPARVLFPALPSAEPISRLAGDLVVLDGLLTGSSSAPVLAPTLIDGVVRLLRLASVGDRPVAIDPDGPWRSVRTELPAAAAVDIGAPAAAWPLLRDAGQRALAAELTAIGTHMLTLAVAHVGDREQFGRRIGSFQAVQQALADVRLWQECAGQAVAAAWEDADPAAALLAKILAGRFLRAAAAGCQQVLGGMGFTWEHPWHRYLRRGLLLEPLLGSAAELRPVLGARLRTDGLPRLAPL